MAGLTKRGKKYYALFYQGKKQKRIALNTENIQLAKEKVRQLESSLYRGEDNPLPTKTPIAKVVTAYLEQLVGRKTPRSIERDTYYLRQTFGPICPALTLKNPKISARGIKRPSSQTPSLIVANCFEQITTADVNEFISARVRRQALKPKTANRYREVLTRLFNWAMTQHGIKMPGGQNPAAKVERYREPAPEISFLTLEQIVEQLGALARHPQLQVMVAVYIYAGLRREELCWLTVDDVDLSSGMIRIHAKTVNGRFWEPKTKKNRVVPISKALRNYLGTYLRPAVESPWFFPSPQGHRWDPDNISRALRAANEASGLSWTCLEYRHTFGSQLAQKGESLYKIATLMGNSPEICRRHYAALVPDSLVDSVEFPGAAPTAVNPPEPPQPAEPPASHLRLVVNNR